jgi:acyl-CoA thioester hydrolase
MGKNLSGLQMELRIDWSELDLFGHVNNVAFFKYIQAARVNYWEQSGLDQLFKLSNHGPILASCHCNFKLPLFYPGIVKVETHCTYIKNTSFSFLHTIFNDKGALAADATDIIVMYDFNKNEKMPFPTIIKSKFEAIEQKIF